MSRKRIARVLTVVLITILLSVMGYLGIHWRERLRQPTFTAANLWQVRWLEGESPDLLAGRRVIAVILCADYRNVPPQWKDGRIITDPKAIQAILDALKRVTAEPKMRGCMCAYSSALRFVFDDYTGITLPFAMHSRITGRVVHLPHPEPIIHGRTWYSHELFEVLDKFVCPVPTITPYP